MYTKAHEIVGILYSYADEGRYKKAALEKQQQQQQQREAQLEAETTSAEKPAEETVQDAGVSV